MAAAGNGGPTPTPENHKEQAAIWAAFQKAFAAVATLPAVVGVTKTLLKDEITASRFLMVLGVSLFASFSLIATARGLRSELLLENYPLKKAETFTFLILLGGIGAMVCAILFTN